MRSSIVLGALCAGSALAFPFERLLHKKALTTEISTKIVWVTVTEGEPLPTSSVPAVVTIHATRTHTQEYTPPSSSSVFVAPAPTTTSSSVFVAPPAPTTSTISTSYTPAPAPVVVSTSSSVAPVVIEAVATSSSVAPVVVQSTAAAVVKAASTTAAASVASPTDYQSTALYHHAMHRANHSAAALTWDDTLAKYALATANTCVFAHDMTEGGGGYGQNLAAYGSSGDISSFDKSSLVADAITNQWYYGEASAVPYGVNSPSTSGPEFLHFTALVWKASTKVGCATVECGAGTIFSMSSLYTVCDYSTEGNVMGAFEANVVEPIGTSAISAIIS